MFSSDQEALNVLEALYDDLKDYAITRIDEDIREMQVTYFESASPALGCVLYIVLPPERPSKQYLVCVTYNGDERERAPIYDLEIDGDIRYEHSMDLASRDPDYVSNPVQRLPLARQTPCWQLPFRTLQKVVDIFSFPLTHRQSAEIDGPDGLAIRVFDDAVDVYTQGSFPPLNMEPIPGLVHYRFKLDRENACLRGKNLRWPDKDDCVITLNQITNVFRTGVCYGHGFAVGDANGHVFGRVRPTLPPDSPLPDAPSRDEPTQFRDRVYDVLSRRQAQIADDAMRHMRPQLQERPEAGVFTDTVEPGDYEKTGKTVGVDDLDDLFDKIDKDIEENKIEEADDESG